MITFERAMADGITAGQLWNVAVSNDEMISAEMAQKWPDATRVARLTAQRDNLALVAKRVALTLRSEAA